MTSELLDVVRAFHGRAPVVDGDAAVVFPEPYAPYLPTNWNRRLIVAEAQNLAGDTAYIQRLHAMSSENRMNRLYWRAPEGLGIAPWDDGTLKLAATAAWPELNIDEFGVANAVFWSQSDASRNLNPAPSLQTRSVELWKELIAVMKPEQVVTVGRIARHVMRDVLQQTSKVRSIRWAPASPVYLNRASWLFCSSDMLSRFPTVQSAVRANPSWVQAHREAKVFYACHAVSTVSGACGTDAPEAAADG
jgi:hypothetical protein